VPHLLRHSALVITFSSEGPPNLVALDDKQEELRTYSIPDTGCGSLVVVFTLSKREVVSSSPARAGRVKSKTFKIGSDCSFAKCTAFRSETHGSFGYDFKNGGPVSQ
jgi:hypothetical protein